MKFLHVSDLHIGKRVNGISMIADQEYILEQIACIACDEGVDALVMAGDIYDKASPSAEAVTVFDAFLTRIADAGIRVLAVPGNHDSAERIAYAQELLARQGVCFPPVFSGQVECVRLLDEQGEVAFWLVPFLKPGDVRRFFPEREIGDDYAAALTAVLESCNIDTSERNVAVSHQLVTAAGVSPDRADDEIKLGGIDNVDVSVYAAFDYVALGHVHRPQRVGRDTVRYSGSPLKYSFSEARYDKSAVLVELGAKAEGAAVGDCVSFRLVPLAPLHDMREVRMTLADLLAAGMAARAAFGQATGGSADAAETADGNAAAGEKELSDAPADAPADATADASADATADASADASADAPDGNSSDEQALALARELFAITDGRDSTLDYLHVTLIDEHPQIDAMARVHELFPNAMSLDYDNAAILASRAEVKVAVDPDKLDTVDLFAKFYEEQVGKPLDDIQHDIVAKHVRAVDRAVSRGDANGEGGAR